MTDTVVDEGAVMIKSFNALAASHAVDTRRRPNRPAEEAEIIEVSFLFNCFVQMNEKLVDRNAFSVPSVCAKHNQIEDE